MSVRRTAPGAFWAFGAAVACGVALTTCLLAGGVLSNAEKPAPPVPGSASGQELAAARRLAHESDRRLRLSTPALDPARARAYARRRRDSIPLPPGGTFTGLRFEDAGRRLEPGLIEQVLQDNAHCQWLRAATEDRSNEADAVLAVSYSWPALRAIAGRLDADRERADCYASHAREVTYARGRHLTPSS